jgi:hypothetical protein
MIVKYTIAVALLAAILFTGTLTFIVQTSQIAHAASFSVVHRVIMDDASGNARGWNPDGTTRVFTISDNEFNSSTSVVVINTHQGNFGICQVDYWYEGSQFFEVNCLETQPGGVGTPPVLEGGPSDGSILRYAIINTEPSESMAPTEALVKEAKAITENRTSTAQNSTGAK